MSSSWCRPSSFFGMRAAYDEVMATDIKRRHEPPRIVGDLLGAEIAEKQARSIKYQLTIVKLPLAKAIDDFEFASTPVNEALIRDLARGAPYRAAQRRFGRRDRHRKSHLVIAIARACIHRGPRGRFILLSISSIGWRAKAALAGRDGSPII
jgi:hypothetical protein